MPKLSVVNPSGPLPPAPRRPIEALALEAGTPDWLLAAAKAYMRWGGGQEVTAEDYALAVHTAANVPLGYGDTRGK